jgi:hypothetical protein
VLERDLYGGHPKETRGLARRKGAFAHPYKCRPQRQTQPSHSGTNGPRRALVGMEQWIEALINVSGLVGFVGVATFWPKNGPTDGLRNR